MKKILHLDVNSYFATLEQQAHPNLRGKPVGVAGKGKGERTVVTSASIEAKKFGLKSGMSTWEALRLCPELIIIPATYDRYSFTSKRIFDLLERFGPRVDIFSIDEAFLDLGEEISWEEAKNLANRIKQLIRTEIGEWVSVSIGISYGRTLAKLASEMQKPDGLTVIRPEDFSKIAEITPIEELCGIGFRLRLRLNRMGITTIAELGRMPASMLVAVFGLHTGSWLHDIGNGRDSNIIHSWRQLEHEKSIGHSYTLPRDVASLADVKKVLFLLAERVGVRLRHKNLLGRTVSVYLRFGDHTGWGDSSTHSTNAQGGEQGRTTSSESPRAKSRGERHSQKEFLSGGEEIFRVAEMLLEKLHGFRPVRALGVTVGDLVERSQLTASIFPEIRRREDLAGSIDQLNNRYGEWTVHRAVIHKIRQRIFNLPDGRDKRKYVPEITRINPFTKRV